MLHLSPPVDDLEMPHDLGKTPASPSETLDILKELREFRSQLPNSSGQEAAVRENRLLILRIDDDLVKLRATLGGFWWTRRWALSAVEADIKLLKSATKNNQDLMKEDSRSQQVTAVKEYNQAQRKRAAANIAILSVLLSLTEARLAQMEGEIDVAISKNRSQTGQEDRELHLVKSRLSASQTQAREAASSARLCLKHFGFLVTWVNYMHSNSITRSLMPLATGIICCNMIYEHSDAMMRFGNQATEASRKYIGDADIVGRLKTWNPFNGPRQSVKQQQEGKDGPASPPSPPRNAPLPTASSFSTFATDPFQEKPPTYQDAVSSWLPTSQTAPCSKATTEIYSKLDQSPEDDFGMFETAQPTALLPSIRPREDISARPGVDDEELIDFGAKYQRGEADVQRVRHAVQPLQRKSGIVDVKPLKPMDSEVLIFGLGPEDNPWA